jgi:hypothetical protein
MVILLNYLLLAYYNLRNFQFNVTFNILAFVSIIIIITCDLCLLRDKLNKILVYIYLLKYYDQTVFEYINLY